MKVTTQIEVRSYELDSYNHVNNAVYQNYLEHARMDFLNKIGFRYNDCFNAGYILPITHIDICYKAMAVLGDTLYIESCPTLLKTVHGAFHQTIKKADGTVCVEADVEWCIVRKDDGHPTKLPDEFMVEGLKPETN
ncbi:Putative thioesterase [Treponema sp. JC4]|uniref:acyl-CoA thioesterase n=1 Tax=Treponema sp. JC4 TaxID=1124982 RepID=UPI00025B02B4|nr:thioesterase family protein [Treponema sp. JC4]EID85287.1 Putative thioesterase [Treponema sp. JC4]